MIEEQARVVRVAESQILIEADRRSACGQCMAKDSCGQKSIAEWAADKMIDVAVANPLQLRVDVGDKVLVGIEERAFLGASVLLYLLPLLTMMVLALTVTAMEGSELAVIVAALIGLGLGFALVRLRTAYLRDKVCYQPQILKVLP
ncbi:MAG: SoxR reducing system RseC family protein [Pseudomonadales bacterium]